ncbi:UDP-glucuronic acid decarboxylase 4 [Physcomitrium patens]|uniref:UDP-glucuronate decarboxylase n=1 Tax=Physcomitrium patens TaxID=3218 RepID=A0A2K1JYN4_PHYPA|nr:UDP-glucuronic acid decarboxylase 4-like [Physcomitrium patens]PNR46641.1 hypothetical protein PHYPA_013761 [Physcomitrium patens]|eukprot:XP_024386418.1 UDP-glucuronic acid decarboxylase 4-like [Physcomitrella patens]
MMSPNLNHRRVEVSPGDEKYTPKPQKQWSLARSAEYVLREQRFVFVLIGVAITTLFFLFLQPEFRFMRTYVNSGAIGGVDGGFNVKDSLGETRFSGNGNSPYKQHAAVITGGAGKIPLGLPRKPLRIVVTGGAGFVGSHLVDRLIERGDSVIVVDNFFTGRKENVQHHFGNPRFELIRHDVVEPLLLEVDQIYHLACPASPVHYKFNPIKTIKTNVVGTLNMLGLAKRIGARFLLTSTSEVYGDPLEHPQKETYWGNVNPIGVRSCYDEGKRTAETLAMDYHRGADVQVRIARIFNTYGPRMCIDDGRVVSNFVAQTLRKEPMTVYGDGKQTRSFQFVSDLVEGLMRLMEGEHVGPFNLGNPGEFTILELAQVVKDVIDPTATIEYKENTSDDPHKRKPDISKAKELLGWEPKISLEKGLPLMVEDFRKRIFGDHKDV